MNCGFTYEIRDKSNPDLVYYGSSELTTLDERMDIHKYNFNTWKKNNNYTYCSSYKVLELGNWEAKMLKIVFFTIRWELHEQERKLIEYQVCVNERIPNRTEKEWREANKINEQKRHAEWREANPNYNTEYYEANKDKIIKQKEEWYQKNKDKVNKKMTCDCGGKYTYNNKTRHLKTPKHQNWVQSQLRINFDKWKKSVGIFTIYF